MNLNRIFNGLIATGLAGEIAGLGAGASLAGGGGRFGGRGRGPLGEAARLRGAAVIGGLAWKAYEQYRAAEANAPGSTADDAQWHDIPRDAFLPVSAAPAARRDLLVLRAMITAAYADGHVDTDERVRVYQRIEALELGQAEKGLLMEEISQPLELYQLVQQVPSGAFATEVYLAAALVADTPSRAHRPARQLFLRELAEQLALPRDLVRALQQQASAGERSAPDRDSEGRSSGLKPLPRATMLSPQA